MPKMNHIFLVFWITVFYGFGAVNINGIILENSDDICKDELCSKENLSQSNNTYNNDENYEVSVSEFNPEFSFSNDTNILTDKEIYFMATSKAPLYQVLRKSISTLKYQEVTFSNLPNTFESTEKINSLLDNAGEHHNTTDLTDVSKSTSEDISSSTVEFNFTSSSILSTIKPNIPPTTQISFVASPSFSVKNSKKKNICLCDLLVNQCDINCCCDEDCTVFHFKIFTKCIDDDNMYNTKYCYRSNFISKNNTSNEIIRSFGDLFCIVRDNLIHNVNYKTAVFTTLETFNKSLPKNLYTFSYKSPEKLKFKSGDNLARSPVWTLQNGELTPFQISYASVGLFCNSKMNIKYLVDQTRICYYQHQPKTKCAGSSKTRDLFHYLKNIKIISNPNFINKSELLNSTKICKENVCIGINSYLCQNINNIPHCTKISENATDITENNCWSALSHVQYKFWHNGSEGIIKMEAYLWVKKLTKISEEFSTRLITEVRFAWMRSTQKVFKRSGNPGYLTGKPILAGKKVYNMVNSTTDKKEAIQLSLDSTNWLNVLGSKKGICSSSERIPINFRENSQFMCSLKLSANNFSKENCVELQNNIFKLLIGNDVINEAKENFFNKFVATFGNSKVEETGDWVQVLIDLLPIISSQATFKSNHYLVACKNIITDLYIDIVYSKIGSFLAPQAKILGVSFQLGNHKDLIYCCDTPGCENTSSVQYFKLSSSVRFVDVSKPAVDAFSEPLSLEAKLPHDFFYPFFSKSVRSQVFDKLAFIVFLSVFI